MNNHFSESQLEAFLDESLPDEQMTAIEAALRDDSQLAQVLSEIIGRRDAGVHTLGAIWRSHRLSCPSREQLGSYLLDVLESEQRDFICFHLETIGCRYCNASLSDLREQHSATDAAASESRRHKYFQSSAGYLSRDD